MHRSLILNPLVVQSALRFRVRPKRHVPHPALVLGMLLTTKGFELRITTHSVVSAVTTVMKE